MKPDVKSLYKIPDNDYDKLYNMLMNSFKNYDKLLGAYPDWDDRQAAIEMVISYYLAYDWKYGLALSLDENLNEALVICHSDEMSYTDAQIKAADCMNERFHSAATRLSAEQVGFWFDFFDEFDRQERSLEIPRPHIYVDYLAVREDLQGQGRGSIIIEKLKEYSDETGLPIMLFTNGEKDVKFYLKNGFRIIGVTKSEKFRFENTYMLYDAKKRMD